MNDIETNRSALLKAAEWFLANIAKHDNVEKVAFCGSICTEKEHPKDIDVLVYLKSDADISRIAELKRKFEGRIARNSMGADVFLIENGKYIGRACRYKEPWVRVICAQEKLCCADRLHLCDTTGAFTLKQELVDNPPVVVLPEFSPMIQVPEDLKAICRNL